MQPRRLLRGGLWLSAGGATSAACSFARNIVVARLVTVEDFGVVVLISLALSVVEMVGNLAVDRLLVQANDGDDPSLQATAHALQVARGLLGGVLLFLAAGWVATLFKIPQATWAFELLAVIPAIRGFVHLDTVRFQREMTYKPTFWIEAVPPTISLALVIPLTYWLRDYSAIVWAMIVQALLLVMMSHWLAQRPYRWKWHRALVRRILAFGWPLLVNGLLMFAIFQGDKAVIAVAFTPEIVGWYGAAFMLSMAPATLVTSVLQSLLLPVLAPLQKLPEEFNRRHDQVVKVFLGVGLLVAAGFVIFGRELLLALFGDRYYAGAEVVVLLGLTQAVRIAKAGEFVSAIAVGATKVPLVSNLARGAMILVAIWLVANGYGVAAVAVAGLVGEVLSYMCAAYLVTTRGRIASHGKVWNVLAWVGLVVATWYFAVVLRGLGVISPVQHLLGLAWILLTVTIYVLISPALRVHLGRWRGRRG